MPRADAVQGGVSQSEDRRGHSVAERSVDPLQVVQGQRTRWERSPNVPKGTSTGWMTQCEGWRQVNRHWFLEGLVGPTRV